MRETLSRQHDLNWREPNIQVWNVNLRGDRSLTLRHMRHNDRPLDNGAEEVVKHVARLWGFRVRLESVDSHDRVLQHWEVTPAPHHGSSQVVMPGLTRHPSGAPTWIPGQARR